METILQQLQDRGAALRAELGRTEKAMKILGGTRTTGHRRPHFSAAARAKIAAAQRARWAKIRAAKKK